MDDFFENLPDDFDMSKDEELDEKDGGYTTKKCLMKLSYYGQNYYGLAYQTQGVKTIEREFFKAAQKSRLIKDRNSCEFSRCGRTDKGVHASGNYFSLIITYRFDQCTSIEEATNDIRKRINSLLPKDIRILEVKIVSENFDARHFCISRMYKYFFITDGLNIDQMIESSKSFMGEHDFKNFCKIDRRSPKRTKRTILDISYQYLGFSIGAFTITGRSFLWHQVRYMIATLIQIGSGKAEPCIIEKLLKNDLSKNTTDMGLAPAYGLVLYDCFYDGIKFDTDHYDPKIHEGYKPPFTK